MTRVKRHLLSTLVLVALFSLSPRMQAQEWKTEKKINIVFGLTQPLLVKGFNAEVNYIHNRLIFDYSHGVSLDFSGSSVTADLRRQGVAVHIPYTTGFGIGYRFTSWLNLRVEPKWHRFEIYYEGDAQNTGNQITSFNTFSLGLGLYGNIRPFKNSESFLSGVMLAPSIRFWPTVSSTLKGDSYAYLNSRTLVTEEIPTLDPGIGFTPIVFNISVGYSFNLKKKK